MTGYYKFNKISDLEVKLVLQHEQCQRDFKHVLNMLLKVGISMANIENSFIPLIGKKKVLYPATVKQFMHHSRFLYLASINYKLANRYSRCLYLTSV